MSVSVVIDGYNLIKSTPRWDRLTDRSLEEAREALIGALAAYRRTKGHPVIVVFDGKDSEGMVGGHAVVQGVGVMFSRPPEDADRVLKRLALQKRDACVMVTSDHEVGRHAARVGATVLTCEEFEERLRVASADAAEHWVEGDEDAEGLAETRQRFLTKKKGNPNRRSKTERKKQKRLRRL